MDMKPYLAIYWGQSGDQLTKPELKLMHLIAATVTILFRAGQSRAFRDDETPCKGLIDHCPVLVRSQR